MLPTWRTDTPRASRYFREQSLAFRLLLASIFLLPLLLGFSAYALMAAFRENVTLAEYDSLQAHTYSLLSAAEPNDGGLVLPEVLPETRFNIPASGLYAMVAIVARPPLIITPSPAWQSASLTLTHSAAFAAPATSGRAGQTGFDSVTIKSGNYFRYFFDTLWEIDGEEKLFRFIIWRDKSLFEDKMTAYRKTLGIWLGGLALLLLMGQYLIARWSLAPLKKLASEIRKFNIGDIQRLDTNYPEEISPVINNLNQLLDSEKEQRKRYKNSLADLAHSLKTPISVIRAELGKTNMNNDASAAVHEQTQRINDIITHQLQRASMKAMTLGLHKTPLCQIIERLGSALKKVYADKKINFSNHVDHAFSVNADESDLLEVFGNIIENAFKYCSSTVSVSAHQEHGLCQIQVDDDGQGIPQNKQYDILQRGARLDTATIGQGIGLSVSLDIISGYSGGLKMEKSRLGGACIIIQFPTTHRNHQSIDDI